MALLFLSVAIDPYAQLKKWREADQAGPGTLYGAIPRLERQGWIEPLRPEERRQPYRITAECLRVLRAKLNTLQQFTKAGLKRLEVL